MIHLFEIITDFKRIELIEQDEIPPKSFEEITNEREDWLKNLPLLLNDLISQLEKKISRLGSFNVIANICVRNQMYSAEDYSDYESQKSPIVPEYVSLLCLKGPFSLGFREILDSQNFAQEIYEINELALSVLIKARMLHEYPIIEKLEDQGIPDLQKIVFSITSEEYFVRNIAIEEHHWDVVKELYSPFDSILFDKLGFETLNAIGICLSIHKLITSRYNQSLDDYSKKWKESYFEIKRFKNNGERPVKFYPEEILTYLSKLPDKQLKAHFMEFADIYEMINLGNRLSFTAKELSDFSNIEINRVESFLNNLSIEFGQTTIVSHPEIIHPLKEKPLVRHEDRFICGSISLLDYSVDKVFDKTLQKGNSPERYRTKKHDYLVKKGIQLLASCLPECDHYSHLKFNDEFNNGELDGLIIYDNCLFFIEGKSHGITDRAKKGFVDRIEKHINEIIKDSHNQALRASQYALKNSSPVFFPQKGPKITIDKSIVRHTFLISLSFDPISNIALYIRTTNDLGLFSKSQFPWVVGLYDLMVIVDHMESTSFLIHFLYKRHEFFKTKKIDVHDELDVMAYYLKKGLYFDNLLEQGDFQWGWLESFSDEINQYYFSKAGVIKRVKPKIMHHSSSKTKELLKAVDKSGLQGRTDLGLFILELSDTSQKSLHEYVAICKIKFIADTQLHDFSFGGNQHGEKWGFTYFIGKNTSSSIEKFNQFCSYKLNTTGSKNWYGIFDTSEEGYKFIDMISLTKGE